MSNSPLPTTLAKVHPLADQVGGHAGVQTTEDDSLLLKPALPREIHFYQLITAAGDDDPLSKLRKWTPKFLGVLKLEGKLKDADENGDGNLEIVPVSGTISFSSNRAQSLVLENRSYGFVKPCILDVKLGTVLYDEDAPPDKKARMIKTAHNTTSGETGIRLTGFQVYSNDSPNHITTPKSYGKSIKKEQLLEGIEMFFPVSLAPYPSPPNPLETSDPGMSEPHPGLPPLLLHRVLTMLEADLEELKAALSNIEMRMIGGSILIVYEGDWVRASKAFSTPSGTGMTEEEEEEDDDDDEVEVEIDENGQIVLESIPDEAMDEDEDEKEAPLCSLSLIDFAHTRLTEGQGADEGVLKGIQTIIDLVRQRREKVAAMLPREGQSSPDIEP
ncbi:SAICAR synthase-like protein [Rhizopogon vinicolor AM-OR11-026]|uniref:Kinase n=1 Tax=Rhizopogon vinicolor AM-OR11-026 TaxID=1314800 RepID=A0A1B7MQY4_9AGAM|nr:SAICAR synthase-like protein [Rhizopogon vinicolor AM-OR11-026]